MMTRTTDTYIIEYTRILYMESIHTCVEILAQSFEIFSKFGVFSETIYITLKDSLCKYEEPLAGVQ